MIFQIKILNEINFFLIIKIQNFLCILPEISMDNCYSECIINGQLTTTMHCNWPTIQLG